LADLSQRHCIVWIFGLTFMKEFKELVREGKVEKRTPDFAEAESLLQQAKERLNDLLTLSLNEQNASFRFESAYESLREALQAFLAKRGYKPYSHEAIIAFVFEEKIISEKESRIIDRYREIRNDINYRATKVTVEETKEIISFVRNILPHLKEIFHQK